MSGMEIDQLIEMTNKYLITRQCVTTVLETLSSRQWCSIFMDVLFDEDVNQKTTQISKLFDALGLDEDDIKILFDPNEVYNRYDYYIDTKGTDHQVTEGPVKIYRPKSSVLWDFLDKKNHDRIWRQLTTSQ